MKAKHKPQRPKSVKFDNRLKIVQYYELGRFCCIAPGNSYGRFVSVRPLQTYLVSFVTGDF